MKNMTEKLYYTDSHMKSFEASVISCRPDGKRFCTILDKTAFFPEGGGQEADTGLIGTVKVTDVQEKNGEIIHYTEGALEEGKVYSCSIDWEQRFERMQGHSGEHIVSGIIHSRFGLDNVGFHMGADAITIDFNGEVSREQLQEVELAANRAVWENVEINARFPSADELKELDYRSKLELTEDVRIVTVEGYDVCACCAPHVYRTGEIGIIKLLDCAKHRGGVRINMLCGRRAYEDYVIKQNAAAEISALLSAKRNEIDSAVKRIYAELQAERAASAELKKASLDAKLAAIPETDGNLCFFLPDSFDAGSLRYLVNEAMKHCTGMAAAFAGSDEKGYSYIIGSLREDLRAKAKDINAALSGRGGGKPEMIQGSVSADRSSIEKYFSVN